MRPGLTCLFAASMAVAPPAIAQQPAPGSTGAAAPAADGADAIAMAPAHEPLLAAAPEAVHASALGAVLPRPEDVEAALPPPPQKVVLDPGYFGAVTLDHAAHLKRRVHCVSCHGPGPVTKLGRIPPGRAHDACRGCHVEIARGPTECRGCHVARPLGDAAVAAAPGAEAAAGEKAAAGAGSSGAAAAAGAPGASAEVASAAPPARSAEPRDPFALRRTIHAGLSMVTGDGGALRAGFAAGVTLRQDGYAMAQLLETSGSGKHQRTVGLLGGGVVLPVRRRLNGQILGVGGFDISQASLANIAPVVGARAGLEWLGGMRWLRTVELSLTGTVDVTRHREIPGTEARGFVLSACLASGFDRPP